MNYTYYNIGDEGYHHSSGKLQIWQEIFAGNFGGKFFDPAVGK